MSSLIDSARKMLESCKTGLFVSIRIKILNIQSFCKFSAFYLYNYSLLYFLDLQNGKFLLPSQEFQNYNK